MLRRNGGHDSRGVSVKGILEKCCYCADAVVDSAAFELSIIGLSDNSFTSAKMDSLSRVKLLMENRQRRHKNSCVEKEGGMAERFPEMEFLCPACLVPDVTSNRNHPDKKRPPFGSYWQLAAKKIVHFLQKAESNPEKYQSVISVMCKLSEDEESMVRSELVQHIPSIALYCQNNSDLKLVISQQLVPYTVKLLNDNHLSVRKLAQTALLVLLENNLIGQLQLSEWICPLVAQLALNPTTFDDQKVEDVTVMSMMIPLVEKELALKYFLDPYISLCSDKTLGIRTVCAMRFGTLCSIAGTEITESSLLPAFLELCKDHAWGVRKASSSVFIEVTNVVSLKTRREVLSGALLKLLDDTSPTVKLAAYQSLGAFICSFADPTRTGFVCENGKLNFLTATEDIKEINMNINCPKMKELIDKQDTIFSNLENNQASTESASQIFMNCIQSNLTKKTSECFVEQVDSLVLTNREDPPANDSLVQEDPLSKDTIAQQEPSNKDAVVQKDPFNNESFFNNFQFWRTPLPSVDFPVVEMMDCNKKRVPVPAHLISYAGDVESFNNPYLNVPSLDKQDLLDDEELQAAFKESILAFKSDELIDRKKKRPGKFRQNPLLINTSKKKECDDISSKSLGDLIMNQDIVPSKVLMKYFDAIMSTNILNPADELNAACAFSFPAVTYTLGRKYWPCLRAVFMRVTRNVQNFSELRNRCAIASSLPQLASMLGHDIVVEDLLPKFLEFLKDVDEVRQSVVLQIPDFLKYVPPEERYRFFVHIEDFLEDAGQMKWRFRCCVAEQLSATLKLCNPHSIQKYFLPVAITLLQDKVSAVRSAAAEFMANIIKNIMDDVKLTLLSKLDTTYRQAHKWNQRQTYVILCDQLAKQRSLSEDVFAIEIVPRLFSLAWDVVPNVRLAVSRCIALTLLPLDYIPSIQKANYDLFLQVMYSLQSDIDDDVRHYGLLSARAYNVPTDVKLPG
ncbi:hypothetical protein CDAR_501461 [Caerostris darwini]|uniref:Serine/threonine-protein phosphatase 4 regulatory subunit 1 n=1 Tax=Caerostris darwini TaxID=1538125 RepID=A0AAV4PR37_9ARAC|nr:hypothetical protein CDAR_501461 [Caerostris darwini]